MYSTKRKQIFTTLLMLVFSQTWATGEEYVLGPDSLPREGIPKGTVTEHTWDTSNIYPDTTSEYWVYVPAQYNKSEPACLIVFQDGQAYLHDKGSVRATNVLDNLIHKGEMPVTIAIFINPSRKEGSRSQRDVQYVTTNDTYARFLIEEIIPEVAKEYNLTDDAAGRAACGMSDGGVCSFTLGWERPDFFSKVISHIGSYVRLKQGGEYPLRIRATRGNPKPIRVFLQDGYNDMNSSLGSWTLSNLDMQASLQFARYDHRLDMGPGVHDLRHGGAILPDTLRWIWRDYPGVKGADDPPDYDTILGQWDITANLFGRISNTVLTLSLDGDTLVGKLVDEKADEIEIVDISLEEDVLTYEYIPPPAQAGFAKGDKPKSPETAKNHMATWLRVSGNTLEGAVASTNRSDFELDYIVTGKKR